LERTKALFPAETPARIAPCLAAPSKDLLNGTGYVRKYIIGIRSDQPNGADNDYQDNGEHYGIFRNVLPFFVAPQSVQMMHNRAS
jgi:hypothetical protein